MFQLLLYVNILPVFLSICHQQQSELFYAWVCKYYYSSDSNSYEVICIIVAAGQRQSGPGLSLHGQFLPNNSFVSAEHVGSSNNSVLMCITDSNSCCSVRAPRQQWLFPNGTRVPLRESGWTFWTSYDVRVIRLHHQSTNDVTVHNVSGLFRCQIPNLSHILLTLYIGIYPTNDSKCHWMMWDLIHAVVFDVQEE